MNNSPRIVFFGTPDFAIPALKALMNHAYDVQAIVTAPDRPAGRGLKITPSPISEYARSQNFQGTLLTPDSIDENTISQISERKPTIGVSVAYGIILPQTLLDIFPKGILNIHPSLLPKYRGPSPLQHQILNGDEICGVTLMQIDAKMDHGPIIAQSSFSVDPTTITYQELHDKSAQIGATLLIETLASLEDKLSHARVQNDADATITRLLKKEQGLIRWSKKATEIDHMVRALNPWPGTFTFAGSKRIRIIKITPADIGTLQKEPGRLYEQSGSLYAACWMGILRIETIQVEGEKSILGSDFIRVHRALLNTILADSPTT
jgi:methionyl-tRNA formyltransferase